MIEMFLNEAIIHGPLPIEFTLFFNSYKTFFIDHQIIPVRTEITIFHCGLLCAGQLDLLAKYEGTDNYIIFD